MNEQQIKALSWPDNQLLPAIVQHAISGKVLMQGYMNLEALQHTLQSGQVTFYSRSKQRLWTKGESSGNTLQLVSVDKDCDADSLLVLARPQGP
ncbi:phosphoribosyl-AMP cyclohydrolase, partial [Arsukibacterium sp.]|uniref:phosphoribosyl-AMP cyclohydrolase n=1 Tax=Arsukibacterium sp. TaxID=1977258 RepID=UPI0035655E02